MKYNKKSEFITVRVTKSTYTKIKRVSKRYRCSYADWVRKLIVEELMFGG